MQNREITFYLLPFFLPLDGGEFKCAGVSARVSGCGAGARVKGEGLPRTVRDLGSIFSLYLTSAHFANPSPCSFLLPYLRSLSRFGPLATEPLLPQPSLSRKQRANKKNSGPENRTTGSRLFNHRHTTSNSPHQNANRSPTTSRRPLLCRHLTKRHTRHPKTPRFRAETRILRRPRRHRLFCPRSRHHGVRSALDVGASEYGFS